jgi:hypothetical protein
MGSERAAILRFPRPAFGSGNARPDAASAIPCGRLAASVVPWSARPMRFVRLRFDGPPPDWPRLDGLYCRTSDAYHLQRVRMSELANDNFNSERVLCRFARLLGTFQGRGQPTGDCKIKRTGVRGLPLVARVCLQIGFCTLRGCLNGTPQGVRAALFEFPLLISIVQAMALTP